MEIVIELPGGRTDLSEPNEFTSFSVRVIGEASVGELARVVAASGLGRTAPGGDHVVVEPGALRRLAAEAVDATWEANFEKMSRVRPVHGLDRRRRRHRGARAVGWTHRLRR